MPDNPPSLAQVGTRFTYGSNKFNGAIEGGYLSLTGGAKGDENAWRIGGTLSQKVGKNVYLVLTTAQNIGAGDEFFATGGFRIGAEQGTETLAGPTKN